MCPNCHSQQIGWITGPNMNINELEKVISSNHFNYLKHRIKMVTRYNCYTCTHKWEEKDD